MGSIIASDTVSEELERFLRAPQASGFPFVDRELQTRHEPLDCRQHFRRRGLAEHAQVVGIVHDFRTEAPGMAQRLPAQYQAPHVEVAGQRIWESYDSRNLSL